MATVMINGQPVEVSLDSPLGEYGDQYMRGLNPATGQQEYLRRRMAIASSPLNYTDEGGGASPWHDYSGYSMMEGLPQMFNSGEWSFGGAELPTSGLDSNQDGWNYAFGRNVYRDATNTMDDIVGTVGPFAMMALGANLFGPYLPGAEAGMASGGGTAAASTGGALGSGLSAGSTGMTMAPGMGTSLGSGLSAGMAGTGASSAIGGGALGTGIGMGTGGAGALSAMGASGLGAMGTGFFGSEGISSAGGLLGGLSGAQGAYQFPYADAIGGILGMVGANQQKKGLEDILNQAINSDLWRSQQSRYFEPLHQAATQGIGNTPYGQSIASDVSRKMSAQGYNMSGNQMHEVAQGLNRGSMDYVNAVGPLATGRPSNAPFGSLGANIANAQGGQWNAGLGALGSIFTGQQPTAGQVMGGAPSTNKGLIDVFKGMMPTL